MDSNTLLELSRYRFKEMIEGWRSCGFKSSHFMRIDPARDSDDAKAFKYLKAKGLVEPVENELKWGLTEAGKRTALLLLEM